MKKKESKYTNQNAKTWIDKEKLHYESTLKGEREEKMRRNKDEVYIATHVKLSGRIWPRLKLKKCRWNKEETYTIELM